MLYIIIPEGMKFKTGREIDDLSEKVIHSEEAKTDTGTNESLEKLSATKYTLGAILDDDQLCDPLKPEYEINLQEIVKEALQHAKNRVVEIKGLTIYLDKPPFNLGETLFLQYQPEKNGKEPTKTMPTLIKGVNTQSPKLKTKYGDFWFQGLPLTKEQLAEIDKQRAEQRANRRHTGDNSTPT